MSIFGKKCNQGSFPVVNAQLLSDPFPGGLDGVHGLKSNIGNLLGGKVKLDKGKDTQVIY